MGLAVHRLVVVMDLSMLKTFSGSAVAVHRLFVGIPVVSQRLFPKVQTSR